MPVEELTSSIDRYQSAHSAAGVPRAFAIGALARSVRPQTFGHWCSSAIVWRASAVVWGTRSNTTCTFGEIRYT